MIEALQCIEIECDFALVEGILDLLEEHGIDNVSFMEVPDSPPLDVKDDNGFPIASRFAVKGYTRRAFNFSLFEGQLRVLEEILGAQASNCQVGGVEETGWLEKVAASFVPITAGPFFVYARDEIVPEGFMGLSISAATAFGSGDHPTTQGCLRALGSLSFEGPLTCLDMGCGSGILAIAMAKRWPSATVIGADNDPEAVRVAKLNAQHNQVKATFYESWGFDQESLQKPSTYEVIAANILAAPLIGLASDMARYAAPGAVVILSGLLESQEPEVLGAYHQAGFRLSERHLIDGWSTLVMER
jgi:ribosomal protein L11 methyltransferase